MWFSRMFIDLGDGPFECGSQGLVGNGAAGLADRRQPLQRPFLRTAIFELLHQERVRQHHQVHMPRLALAAAQLTRSHAQLLFAIAVKGFCAGPTITVRLEDPIDFPPSAIGDQSLREFLVTAVAPNHDNSHGMLDLRQTNRRGVIPLTCVASPQLAAFLPWDRSGKYVGPNALATDFQLAIGLQVAHVSPRFTMLTSSAREYG
jgi:hypothetical protein